MDECFTRLDLYISMILESYTMEYVCENYIQIREDYYNIKDGGK